LTTDCFGQQVSSHRASAKVEILIAHGRFYRECVRLVIAQSSRKGGIH